MYIPVNTYTNERELNLSGKILKYHSWISKEKPYVNFTGGIVNRLQNLFTVYNFSLISRSTLPLAHSKIFEYSKRPSSRNVLSTTRLSASVDLTRAH